jgi:NAD(P)H dehydrogenase (quinone)
VPDQLLLAVTAATGQLGRRVTARLTAAGLPHRVIVRDPSRFVAPTGVDVMTAAYEGMPSMVAALAGVDTLLLISASESADRVDKHYSAVDSATAAGVRRIIYVSFLGAAPDATFTLARDHWRTEERIKASGLTFTFLRDSLYLDVIPYFVGEDRLIRGPAGDGRFAGVARDDVAAVAEAVLTGDGHDGRAYDVTGPAAFTMAEAAATLTEVVGRPIGYHAETESEAYESRAKYGAPEWEVAGWVTSYSAVAAGELNVVSSTVGDLTGRPAQSFEEYLRANPGGWAHLAR